MTGQKTKTERPTLPRSATAEEYKKQSGWLIGTLHRASPSVSEKVQPNSQEKATKETK